ncbi:MAG: thiamine-phosphate kinase [Rhodospirillaceae bacterium]|jgi:thiamine-monophosphate kinase|nr:thiamine-phosphate kinase [Rhodospirillaceae bacterium]MBT5664466.1 thiamine-phosphate kinase [Rhodospirillaceae bacterium]
MKSGEFERIARYFAPLAAGFPGAFGLTDDAAVLAPSPGHEFAVTTDTIVEGVHFVGDEPPAQIAAKMLRVNLSDIAAMGARAVAYTLNVALRPDVNDDWLDGFCAGLRADQDKFGVHLMGGDSVATHGPVVLTVTAFGEAPCGRALRRNGATPGDLIFVSGTIGDAALGLRAVQGHLLGLDDASATALAARYRLPEPRMALGTALVGVANAAADVSDGLVADLGHIVDASGVGAVVNWDCVPISTAARAAAAFVDDLPSAILTGGDDYELVFTASLDAAKAFPAMARRLDIPLSEIGVVTAGEGVRVVGADGLAVPLGKTGYVHC